MGDRIVVGIHQPNFLPWLGYFHKLVNSDIFVLLDSIQYTKNSFINRNRIKTPQGTNWLTVPAKTKGRFGQFIKDVEINNKIDWRKKHLRTLEASYRRARFFEPVFQDLKAIYYADHWDNLCELNIRLLEWVLSVLKLDKELVRASELNVRGESTRLLIDIVNKMGGDVYLSGFGGAKYQEEELFKEAGVGLAYYEFECPIYPQLWGEFAPNLSIIDLLFNHGIESLNIIKHNKDNNSNIQEITRKDGRKWVTGSAG